MKCWLVLHLINIFPRQHFLTRDEKEVRWLTPSILLLPSSTLDKNYVFNSFFFTTRWHFTLTSQAGNPYCWALSYIDEYTLLNYYHIKSKMATRDVWWREREVQGGDERGYNWRHLYFTYSHPVNHLPSLSLSLLLPLLRSLRALRFHTHPQLLVPEQQFASGFIELQPVDLGVVADGSKIVASGQVHWGGEKRTTKTWSDWQLIQD